MQFDCDFRGLMKPKEGAHITIMRQEKADASVLSYDGLEVEFEYEHSPETNSKHVWLPVVCPRLSDIRVAVNLPSEPEWDYHLTIGVMPGEQKGGWSGDHPPSFAA